MENPPPADVTRTTICSVVFVDIVGYSKLTVAKQLATKGWLNDLLLRALRNLSPTERLILDTGDGAALCFMNDPEDALFVANGLRVALVAGTYPDLELRIGINLGPVKIVTDINGRPNMIGDGINWAQRVMGFAAPNQLLVSRSYYEVVSCLSEEHALLFGRETTHRDKHDREHHVYEVCGAGPPRTSAPGNAAGQPTSSEPAFKPARKVVDADAGLDARVLATLSEELCKHLGPIAPIMAEKAARTASDRRELVRLLADSIPIPHERSAFIQRASSRLGVLAGPEGSELPQVAPAGSGNTGPYRDRVGFSKEALTLIGKMLTAHIGPLAAVLVSKAAKTATSPDDLLATLARSIDDEQARAEFLSSAELTFGPAWRIATKPGTR